MKWNCTDYVKKSMLFIGEYNESLVEYAHDNFAIWSSGGHILLIVKNWKVVHALKDAASGNVPKSWISPLPYFDLETFPFLACNGQEHYTLCNVKTGALFPLVQGSALNSRI